jgi:uncharacterized phage-associated protein
MPLGQRFDAQKATEAILYIAERVKDPSFHRIAKLLYFADKHKLAAYGGLVVADEYVAMKHGPVPSSVYDILKAVRGDGAHPVARVAGAAFEVVNSCRVATLRRSNLNYLSKADIESLDMAIHQYGAMSFDDLTHASHDKAWDAADENEFMSLEEIARATSSPEAALAAVHDRFTLASVK